MICSSGLDKTGDLRNPFSDIFYWVRKCLGEPIAHSRCRNLYYIYSEQVFVSSYIICM